MHPSPRHRFFVPGPLQAGLVVLPERAAHHALRVLRLREGDALALFDGSGGAWHGAIERAGRERVEARLTAFDPTARESTLDCVLAQGISSGERMDYTLQKAVELGVRGIQPLATHRSVVKLDAERAAKRLAHWREVVVSACEQCGRERVPEVAPVETVDAWLGRVGRPSGQGADVGRPSGRLDLETSRPEGRPTFFASAGSHTTMLLLDPQATLRLADLPHPAGRVVLLAGPEGGFDAAERAAAHAAGCIGVRLGPRILRTETAALAALAAMQTLWGDF
jgi:16S rRNA (uracil1498-N3)-methyltransferase